MNHPTPNGPDGTDDPRPPRRVYGRDTRGRFVVGNPGGPGNPYASRVSVLRSALIHTVNTYEVPKIARALVERAKAGDVAAARLVLGYALGKPGKSPRGPGLTGEGVPPSDFRDSSPDDA